MSRQSDKEDLIITANNSAASQRWSIRSSVGPSITNSTLTDLANKAKTEELPHDKHRARKWWSGEIRCCIELPLKLEKVSHLGKLQLKDLLQAPCKDSHESITATIQKQRTLVEYLDQLSAFQSPSAQLLILFKIGNITLMSNELVTCWFRLRDSRSVTLNGEADPCSLPCRSEFRL